VSKRSHGPNKQERKTCIFCGGFNLSKEHVWPNWTHKVLTDNPSPAHHEWHNTFSNKGTVVKESGMRTRQGSTFTKKLRVVCKTCNNGWMSRLENDTKPILLTLIQGEPTLLDREQQTLLAQWIVLKVMITEWSRPLEAFIPKEDRRAFMDNLTIPPYLEMWVITNDSEKWKGTFLRQTALLAFPGPRPPGRRNSPTVAIGFGRLFIFVMMTLAAGMKLSERIGIHAIVPKLFPYASDTLPLPFVKNLDDQSAVRMAYSLDMLIQSPNTKWFP
jgi:hypothetical protein